MTKLGWVPGSGCNYKWLRASTISHTACNISKDLFIFFLFSNSNTYHSPENRRCTTYHTVNATELSNHLKSKNNLTNTYTLHVTPTATTRPQDASRMIRITSISRLYPYNHFQSSLQASSRVFLTVPVLKNAKL